MVCRLEQRSRVVGHGTGSGATAIGAIIGGWSAQRLAPRGSVPARGSEVLSHGESTARGFGWSWEVRSTRLGEPGTGHDQDETRHQKLGVVDFRGLIVFHMPVPGPAGRAWKGLPGCFRAV